LRAFPADEIELFAEFMPSPDITMIPFVLKTILNVMKGTRVVELGVDATYGTNSSGLECYAFMTEYDGAGLPLVYFLLSTATSTTIGKRRDAIAGLAAVLWDKYDIHPRFFHTDKDMAQISAGKAVWSKSCKIQQCEWHMEHALTARFSDSKQSTTPYDPRRANKEFSFIDINFKPSGTPDRAEHEGGLLPEDETYLTENLDGTVIPPVKSLKLKLPPRSSLLEVSGDTSDGSSSDSDSEGTSRPLPRVRLILSQPKGRQSADPFIPKVHHDPLIRSMKEVFNAHPFFPNVFAPNPHAIREWAVKKIYEYCYKHELRGGWAYLWENWLRFGRWENWARSTKIDEVSILKTTMFLEAHWRHLKEEFLHHFSNPRPDLLIWIILEKMVPQYYEVIHKIQNPISRYRDMPSWRADFKREWFSLESRPESDDARVEDRYKPNPYYWVCTCPSFSTGRWLLCKHLFREVKAIQRDSQFFNEAHRNRVPPFLTHRDLVPLKPRSTYHVPTFIEAWEKAQQTETAPCTEATEPMIDDDGLDSSGDNVIDGSDNLVSEASISGAIINQESHEELRGQRIGRELEDLGLLFTEFGRNLIYNAQFRDPKVLDHIKTKAAGLLTFIKQTQDRDNRNNDARSHGPRTWESGIPTAVMRWHTQPRERDRVQ
jgi:hypothetical protein